MAVGSLSITSLACRSIRQLLWCRGCHRGGGGGGDYHKWMQNYGNIVEINNPQSLFCILTRFSFWRKNPLLNIISYHWLLETCFIWIAGLGKQLERWMTWICIIGIYNIHLQADLGTGKVSLRVKRLESGQLAWSSLLIIHMWARWWKLRNRGS